MKVCVNATVNVTIVWQHNQTNSDSQCTETKHNAHTFAQISIANCKEHRKHTITWHTCPIHVFNHPQRRFKRLVEPILAANAAAYVVMAFTLLDTGPRRAQYHLM